MFFIFTILLSIQSAFGQTNAMNRECVGAQVAANRDCAGSVRAGTCTASANLCAAKCSAAITAGAALFAEARCTLRGQPCTSLSQYTGPWVIQVSQCQTWAANGTDPADPADPRGADPSDPIDRGDALTKCRAFKARTDSQAKLDALIQTPEVLGECVDACKQATEGGPGPGFNNVVMQEAKTIGEKCFNAIPQEPDVPKDEDTTVADVEGGDEDDGNTTGTDDTTATTPTTTNDSNPLSFGSTPPTVGQSLGNPSMMNWATGPTADPGIYGQVASDVTSAAGAGAGFQIPGGTSQNLMKSNYLGNPSQQQQAAAGGSGGGMPASPFMGGANSAGGTSGGGGRGGGSGGGRGGGSGGGRGGGSGAGSQLGKVGQNSYYSGGGSLAPGQNTNKGVTTKGKKPAYNPKYAAKTDDGGAALLRMFGKNPKAEYYYRKNQMRYADYGKSCLNTVFCGIENRFQDLLKDYDTGDITTADTDDAKTVRDTASEKKPIKKKP